ncbi:hypothetical protein PHLCEN_2v5075 [Hermanssonia centrifuga]|uniref:Oligopeptide transporter n=1 Tax=Hermanssonia centrifuga TaxID=98765 RepID=A0A2R6PC01_9APHY|nr:hypothetical protein PHLCEN_2v5075 [Hermanssonia centrifuga]
MPLAAGFVGILPALGMLDETRDGAPPLRLSWLSAVGWSCAVAFFGVFLSPPLRKQVIVEEQLAFPSGTATAQLISVLHHLPPPDVSNSSRVSMSPTTSSRRRGYREINHEEDIPSHTEPLIATEDGELLDAEVTEFVEPEGLDALTWSFLASGVMTLAAYFLPALFSIPLFGHYLAREWLWTFTPSLSYIGQGIIMGFPTTLSMNLGMLVGWGILSPISKLSGWAPGPVGDMTTGARGWILWTSLAIMCTDSLVSLVPVVSEILTEKVFKLGKLSGPDAKEDKETESEDRLVPMRWVLWGSAGSIFIGTILVWAVFGNEGIKPWATVIGYVIGALLSVLGFVVLSFCDGLPHTDRLRA